MDRIKFTQIKTAQSKPFLFQGFIIDFFSFSDIFSGVYADKN